MFGEAGRLLAGALDGRRDQVVIARKIRTRRRTAVAQKIQTLLIDDIDGSAAEDTVPVRAGRHRLCD